jgi:hypothetical protein
MTLEQLTTLPPDAFFQLTGQVHPHIAALNIWLMMRPEYIPPTPHRWVGGRVHEDDCGCGRCGALGVNGEMR